MEKYQLKFDSVKDLENRGYLKTIDTVGQYIKGCDLYYKQIQDRTYIVFNHYNKGKKEWLQGFDCWISAYSNINDIGKVKAQSSDRIKLSFDMKEDWHYISQKVDELENRNEQLKAKPTEF